MERFCFYLPSAIARVLQDYPDVDKVRPIFQAEVEAFLKIISGRAVNAKSVNSFAVYIYSACTTRQGFQ